MSGDKDWFFEQTRPKRKEILSALHLARQLMTKNGYEDRWGHLEDLLNNLEGQHSDSKIPGPIDPSTVRLRAVR